MKFHGMLWLVEDFYTSRQRLYLYELLADGEAKMIDMEFMVLVFGPGCILPTLLSRLPYFLYCSNPARLSHYW